MSESGFNAAFWKWFSESKVVDSHGQPLVVYHGTNKNIAKFSLSERTRKTGNPNARLGFFFSPSHDEASRYAKDWGKAGGNVIAAYLSIQNPYLMPYKEFDDLAMAAWRLRLEDPKYDPNKVLRFGDVEGQKLAAKELEKYNAIAADLAEARRNELIGHGYDGVVVMSKLPEYVAFYPEQIKSAVGNDGTWDADDPSIMSNPPSSSELLQGAKHAIAAGDREAARLLRAEAKRLRARR